jgi:hypothetical protein
MHSLTFFFCKLQNLATSENSFLQSILSIEATKRLTLAEIIKHKHRSHSCELGETIEFFAKNP